MTIRETLAGGSAELAAAGIESPGLDASLLLAEVLSISRSSLTAVSSDAIPEESIEKFFNLIKRRLAGECTAYLTGKKEFYGLEFNVNPSVLVPRPETETLVEETLKQAEIKNKHIRILDLCTGSGAIAVAIKHELPETEVWAADISAEALAVAETNAARLLPPESIHFCSGNLFESLLSFSCTPFNFIVSNPPYIPTSEIANLSPEVRNEPLLALDGGSDGLEIIKNIISRSPDYLCPGGTLLLEADPRQMEGIASLYEKSGFTEVTVYRDLGGRERVIRGKISIQMAYRTV